MSEGSSGKMSSSGYVVLPKRGVIALSGPESVAFLQGLISCDLAQITAERAGYGALLTPQGKFLFDFMVLRTSEALLLEVEHERIADLLRRLTMYRLRAKVDLEDVSARYAVAAVLGDDLAVRLELSELPGACRRLGEGWVFVDPRLARLGARAVLPAATLGPTLDALGFAPLEPATYERIRITEGVPDGSRDLTERSTLLESGFEELHGVDFAKGCFVGQELTARMKYRGLVRKRLLPVVLKGTPPEPGTIIRLGEREAGEMRSSIEDRGIALLRLDRVAEAAQGGEVLHAGATEVIPLKPDWANF
jgi:folate-binding protein YgfZ